MMTKPPTMEEGQSILFSNISNVMAAYIHLITGFLLLIPPTYRTARHFHPFRLRTSSDKVPKKASAPGELRIRGTRREVQSIYEDWPDPIPFPVTTLYNFTPTSESELAFSKAETLMILDCRGNWWQAKNPTTGAVGFIPSNFVQVLQKAKVIKRYLASSEDEASIHEDQTVEVMEHHDFLSLIRTVESKIGSVPTSCLELINDPSLEKLKVYHPNH